MMSNSIKIVIFISLLSTYLLADSKKHYVGIGGSETRANTYTISKEKMTDIVLRYGYILNNYLDIELRGNLHLFDGIRLDHPFSYGLFLKPNYNIGKQINIYGLLGYSQNRLVKQDKSQTNTITTQNDFSYGAGVEYGFGNNLYVFTDFIRYIDKSTTREEGKYAIKIDSINFGLNYKFGDKTQTRSIDTDRKPLEEVKVDLKQSKQYPRNIGLDSSVDKYVKSLKADRKLRVEIRAHLNKNHQNIMFRARKIKEMFIKKGINSQRVNIVIIKDNKHQGHIRIIRKIGI